MMSVWMKFTVDAECCARIQIHNGALTVAVSGAPGFYKGTVLTAGGFSGAFAGSGCSFDGQFRPTCEPRNLKGTTSCDSSLSVVPGSVHAGANCPSR